MANEEADKLVGRAWEEEYNTVKPQPVAPHYRQSTALQTLLLDGSISGNLAWNIPEEIMTLRSTTQLRRTLKMTEEHMALIDKEMTASNTRKFGKSSSDRTHFSKQREPTNSMIEYQQRVDAVLMEKTRRFYIFCDVQSGQRFTQNTSKPLDDK